MVFARLSDTFGRKPIVLAAWVLFTAFSLGCGLSQSIVQLYVDLMVTVLLIHDEHILIILQNSMSSVSRSRWSRALFQDHGSYS